MSKANVFADVLSSQRSIHVAQSLDTPSTSFAPSVASNDNPAASTSTPQPSTGHLPTYPIVNGSEARVIPMSSGRKGKQRLAADQKIINDAFERFHLNFAGSSGGELTLPLLFLYYRVSTLLMADHLSVMFPDVDTPFFDTEDVVRRLLPYHVLQQPAKDLRDVIVDPSGKGKAREIHENGVYIEGGRSSNFCTPPVTDGHRRHQVGNRISQKGPLTSPTVPKSENEILTGTERLPSVQKQIS